MTTSTKTPTIEALEDVELSVWMSFLIDNEADEEMLEAIEQAMEDNRCWSDPDAERNGRVQSGSC